MLPGSVLEVIRGDLFAHGIRVWEMDLWPWRCCKSASLPVFTLPRPPLPRMRFSSLLLEPCEREGAERWCKTAVGVGKCTYHLLRGDQRVLYFLNAYSGYVISRNMDTCERLFLALLFSLADPCNLGARTSLFSTRRKSHDT
jgi:hypothetical protein